jgi:hypothetical protein
MHSTKPQSPLRPVQKSAARARTAPPPCVAGPNRPVPALTVVVFVRLACSPAKSRPPAFPYPRLSASFLPRTRPPARDKSGTCKKNATTVRLRRLHPVLWTTAVSDRSTGLAASQFPGRPVAESLHSFRRLTASQGAQSAGPQPPACRCRGKSPVEPQEDGHRRSWQPGSDTLSKSRYSHAPCPVRAGSPRHDRFRNLLYGALGNRRRKTADRGFTSESTHRVLPPWPRSKRGVAPLTFVDAPSMGSAG